MSAWHIFNANTVKGSITASEQLGQLTKLTKQCASCTSIGQVSTGCTGLILEGNSTFPWARKIRLHILKATFRTLLLASVGRRFVLLTSKRQSTKQQDTISSLLTLLIPSCIT